MNADLLKFDASSIRELLRRKLIESGLYTDQLYPGSDTSILIDLFSWTFNVLVYILNENAADALFSDSSVYENINKIVKLLSYNPKAYITSNAYFSIEFRGASPFAGETLKCVIPKFTSIVADTGVGAGQEIRFSFGEDYSFNVVDGVIQLSKHKPLLYNGTFKKYVCKDKSAGSPFEVFIMENVSPESANPVNVDADNIHIYVETTDEDGIKQYTEYKIVQSLVIDATSSDELCEVRLNENKEFEVKFGDGIHGKRLNKGDTVNIIYLASDGVNGVFDAGEFSVSNFELFIDGFSSKEEMLNMIYGGNDRFIQNYGALFSNGYAPLYSLNYLKATNINASSTPIDYEDPETIKEFAPASFRLGNRLVTASDFRTYILTTFKNRVKDVYVCNNNEYCTTFYRWLDAYGKLDVNIRLLDYEYADACDFNNIYAWLKPIDNSIILDSDRKQIVKKCDKIKQLTTNIIPCNGIKRYFMPFVKSTAEFVPDGRMLLNSFSIPTKIIIKKGSTFYSDAKIKSEVAAIITKYFLDNSSFGDTINLAYLQQKIMSLGYIEEIQTVSTLDEQNGYYISKCNGLSFAAFTPEIVSYEDFEVFTQNVVLEKFQYGELLNASSIAGLITVSSEDAFSLKNDEF